MPEHETPADDEQQLFDLLDQYVTSLSEGDADVGPPPEELVAAFPELAGLLDCLDSLDSLAGETVTFAQGADSSLSMLSNSRPTPEEPCDFGRYVLLSEIGRGGMGVVFAARQKLLEATIALKVIRASQFASDEEIRRFYSEAKAAAGLRHANIVAVHDVGEWQGQHFLTMDFIEGPSLGDVLQEQGPLDPRRAAALLATVARAVDYLHDHNLIHRDLKPTNILLDVNGIPHVADFGLAKVFEGEGDETVTGTIIGTPSYMSPEQAAGRSSEVSPRSDVYSLGAVLYEMLTGRPPFKEENPLDTLLQVLEAEPESPRQFIAAIPTELEAICLACLEKDPDDRFESAAVLAEELERYLDGEPIRIKPRSKWDRFKRWTRREPALASRLAVVAAGTVVVQGNYAINRFAHGITLIEHGKVMIIIGAWAVACVLFQKLMNREAWEDRMQYVWAVGDVLFLTALLTIARPGESIGPILIGYPLLVVASGLWFCVPVVWFMTALSSVGYVYVCLVRHDPPVPQHYPFLYVIVLWGVGYIVTYQVARIRALSRHFERRR